METHSATRMLWQRQDTNSSVPVVSTELLTASNVPVILGASGGMLGLATLVVALRIYVRLRMVKTFGADDVVIVFSLLCAFGSMVCFVGETRNGAGHHLVAVTLPQFIQLLKFEYFHGLMLVIGISLVKVSIAFFLLRLVQAKWYRRSIISIMVFIVLFTISCCGTLIFQCIPIEAAWTLERGPGVTCFSTPTFSAIGVFNGVVNIITDLVFVFLPFPMIIRLQVNTKTKVTLALVLSLGLFACASSIVRVYLGAKVFTEMDFTWSHSFMIWNNAELITGIIASSLPALRPLFASILETTSRTLRTRGYLYGSKYDAEGNKASGLRSHNRYVRQDDDIKMGAMARQHQHQHQHQQGAYNARVTAASGYSVGEWSDDDVLPPPPKGIKIQTDITVH